MERTSRRSHRAQAFYRRHGFAPDGRRVDEPFFGVPEIRMVRRVHWTPTPVNL